MVGTPEDYRGIAKPTGKVPRVELEAGLHDPPFVNDGGRGGLEQTPSDLGGNKSSGDNQGPSQPQHD